MVVSATSRAPHWCHLPQPLRSPNPWSKKPDWMNRSLQILNEKPWTKNPSKPLLKSIGLWTKFMTETNTVETWLGNMPQQLSVSLLVQFCENKHQKQRHPKVLALSRYIISFYLSLKLCEFFCWISEKSQNRPKMHSTVFHSAPIAPPEVLQPVSTGLCAMISKDMT